MHRRIHDLLIQCRLSAEEFLAQIRHCFAEHRISMGPNVGSLENRVLLSATPMQLPQLDDFSLGTFAHYAQQTETNADASAQSAMEGISSVSQFAKRTEVAFIDSSVSNYEQLIADLEGRDDADFHVFLLSDKNDGIEQISRILLQFDDLDAVHLVSHGRASAVELGDVWLSNDNLSSYASHITNWRGALDRNADILIYGCNLASAAEGQELVESLSSLTDADIAASVDDTGHRYFAGDWDLEFKAGTSEIETVVAFSNDLQEDWVGKLAMIDVTITADIVDSGDSETSLREAILQVNAGSGGDTINLPAGTYFLTIGPNGDDSGNTGDLDLLKSATIVGAGAETTFINGSDFDRIFHIQNNSTVVTISGVTMERGFSTDNGGGIFVDNSSVLNLRDSVVSNNDGDDGRGGAIHVHGTLNLERVLISNNSAKDGGGIHFHGADGGSLLNVTVSGNSATDEGGGIWTDDPISIVNSTMAFNTAADGGGVFDKNGNEIAITGSILHNPSSDNSNRSINSGGFNIDSDNTAALTGLGDLQVDPLLNPLADNGGSTLTHSFQTGSVAIDAGANFGAPATDQTGQARNEIPDIGAFESYSLSTKIYWAESGSDAIYRANGDGTAKQQILSGLGNPHGLEVDVNGGKIYWIETTTNTLHAANLDGSGAVTFNSSMLKTPYGLGLDLVNGHIYVADDGNGSDDAIRRFDLDGSNPTTIITHLNGIIGDVAIDPIGNRAYFTKDGGGFFDGAIQYVDLSGGAVTELKGSLVGPTSLSIDQPAGRLYYSDNGSSPFDFITSIDLDDGTGAAILPNTSLSEPSGIALDLVNGKAYWADAASNFIRRSDFDGGNAETILTGLNSPQELAVITVGISNSLPIADVGGPYGINEGGSVNLDGSGSFDGDFDTLTYRWDLNNDSVFGDVTTVNPTVDWSTLQSFGIIDDGIYSIRLQVDDGNGGLDIDSTTITVANLAPIANDDSGTGFITNEDNALTTSNVLINDSDPAGSADPIAVTGIDLTGTQGLVINNGDGKFLYDPNGAFDTLVVGQSTTDSFDYSISDGDGGTSTATVTITINGRNDAPQLSTGSPFLGSMITTDTLTPFSIAGLLNSFVSDADSLSITGAAIVGLVGNGNWEYTTDGTIWTSIGTVSNTQALLLLDTAQIRYTGDGVSVETATISYRAWDETASTTGQEGTKQNVTLIGAGGTTPFSSNVDTASISVSGANVNPSAVDDSYSLDEGDILNVGVVANWFNTNWKSRQQLTFDNSLQATDLIDFSVLVKLHATAGDAVNIDYDSVQNGGEDIRFVDSDGTLLDHEIELWDEFGYSYVWVRVPQIDGGSNTDSIWMYYDNPAAMDGQSGTSVWNANQQAVLHMTTPFSDSSSHANHGIDTDVSVVNGNVADGGGFNASTSNVNLGSDSSLDDVFAGGGTISAWINASGWGENGFGRIADKASTFFGPNGDGWTLQVGGIGNDGYLIFEHGFTSQFGEWQTVTGTLTLNNWYHVAAVYDNSNAINNVQIYINGVLQTVSELLSPAGTARSDATLDLVVGDHNSIRSFDGIIDEVRISSTAVNGDWLAASYRSELGNFMSSSGVESGPGGVLQNDFDGNSDPITVSLVSGPNNAISFVLNSDGSFSYQHDGSETTIDSFRYQSADGTGGINTATVTLNVNPVNDVPTAIGDSYSLDEGTFFSTSASNGVLDNDIDPDGDPLSSTVLTGPSNASVFALNLDGSFAYTHDGSETTSDSFTYQISDGNGGFHSALVSLTINSTNDDPTAAADFYVLDEGASIAISAISGVLTNDFDSEGDPLSSTVLTDPSNASVFALNLDGSFAYTHDGGETTFDSFTYQISDGNGGFHSAVVSLTINSINDVPTATDDSYILDEGGSISISSVGGVLTNDFDPDGDPLSSALLTGPSNALGFVLNMDGSFDYSHDGSETTFDAFTYQINDGNGGLGSAIVSLTINSTNDAPTIDLLNIVNSIDENTDTTTRIKLADIAVVDDGVGTNDVFLAGQHASFFEIVGTELFLRAGTNLNYEFNSAYNIRVEVDDTGIGTTSEDFVAYTLSVADLNEGPTASFVSVVSILGDDSDTSSAIKVAEIVIWDDALGSYTASLTGPDATLFQIIGNAIYLRANSNLNSASNPLLDVTLELDDPTIPGSPDVTTTLSVEVTTIAVAPSTLKIDQPNEDTVEETDIAPSPGLNTRAADEIFAVDFKRPRVQENTILLSVQQDAELAVLPNSTGSAEETSIRFQSDYVMLVEVSNSSQKGSDAVVGSTESLSNLANRGVFWNQLDTLQNSVAHSMEIDQFVIRTFGAATSSLTVGYVIWILRGGVLMTSLLAQLPAWKFMDPMVILAQIEDTEFDDDDSLESIVDSQDENVENEVSEDLNIQHV